MNKIALVTVVIAGNLFTAPLLAASFFNKLIDSKPYVLKSTKAHVKKEGQNYTDFTGNWTGSCSYDDKDIEVFLTLKNDDTKITIYDEIMNIGSLNTSSTSNSDYAEYEHTALEWSEDISTLIIKEVSISVALSHYPYNTPRPIETFSDETSFSLNNGQLVVKYRQLNMRDMEKVGTVGDVFCTLSKDPD
ncbi:hypothetical protein [Legionella worsleiensis]|uniref:Secreted protein n=1 Tax=Legionella worsleiensis TaxID=45076 RepID=A0A0W1AKS1_9GAMM|nr:hypothetical protein [Legionella worsleiensis]KTD81921.1 hypothetical protein Lwor_0224 [Legionella worsleiensis]STY31255.1 Uncharacterised protein [Legionella worsleiensis]